MAYTKIIKITTRLDRSVNYVLNQEKTGLQNALDYAMNRDKTETTYFETAFNCRKEYAFEDMTDTKKRWKKDGDNHVLGYHIIQSFKPGESTPEQTHAIGTEFVRRYLADKYEAVVSTHLDRHHLHCHIVFNSVAYTDGRMYRNNFKDYFVDIRGISDQLCREHGLSVIEHPKRGKPKHYAEWRDEQEGKPTWRGLVCEDVGKAIAVSITFTQFLSALRKQGYEIKTGVKHMAVRPLGKERFIRLRSLGDDYTEEAIKQRILRNHVPRRPQPEPEIKRCRGKVKGSIRRTKNLTGL